MKALTRLLLVNWHYFQNTVIDFGNINFLTGKNSAGKSTIIDALQVVLMGETRSVAFNRAASKKSERTLRSYLVGSMGEDIENGNKSLRDGKDFSTYIVAEFYDDFKSAFFCLGAVFDTFADGSDINKRFFWLKNSIPTNRFIENGKTMDTRRMTQFFKEKYPNKFETKDTSEGYRRIVLEKLNIHDENFISMLKKAISFEPINDIEKFITENVCDIEDDIDIVSMQENILYYKQQEDMAKRFEGKLRKLEEICRQYAEIEKLRSRRKIQQFLIDYGTYNSHCLELEQAQADFKKYNTFSRIIPETEQKISEIKSKIDMEYSEEYRNNEGIPRYSSELAECGSPSAVSDKFNSPVKGTISLISTGEKELVEKRNEYNMSEQASFRVSDVNNNDEYDEAYRKIRDYELPNYREKIEKAKNDAMEQFKSDFIYKLRANIQSAEMKIDDLNNALKMAQFGNDKYRFSVEPNPAFLEYYNMLMSSLLDDGTEGLFSFNFTEKYKSVIDNLFEQIISFDSNSEKSTQSVKMFSKYQTYLTFDLITTDSSGRREKLSKSINTKSGGETQTPFYIAVLASFARLYRTNDPKETGNTMRLVIFDEAFNKMDGERIIESIKLLRKFGLQAIICSPPEKASDIAPIADKTQLVYKEAIGEVYRSTVVEWTKEMSEING